MEEELKEKLLKILEELPDESPWLDYKEIPYKKDDKFKKAEFLKDICGFLNCTESYGKDKFIILGIVDKTKFRRGINDSPMEDDKYYQDLFELIQPRPHIETGKITKDNLDFGYIYIPKDNMERVYSFIKDYPDEFVSIEEERNNFRKKVYASTAYIRKGSVKYLLNEYDRRKIYEQDKMVKNMKAIEKNVYASTQIDDGFKDVLKICALFGTWNEQNENEKEIISKIIGIEYQEWIKTLRKLLSQKSEYVSFKNNVWKIEQKENLIERYSEEYFPEDINRFKEAAVKILIEADPKFELESDKRVMSNILGIKTVYSKSIKKSVLETFAIMRSLIIKFTNCRREVSNSLWYVIRETLKEANWQLIATLDDLLPIMAEIDGQEYINQLNSFIGNQEELEKLFKEKEENVFTTKYVHGIYWSLELLAWNPRYLMAVFDMFCRIERYDKEIMNTMVRILLPWYPQTKADIALRVATVGMTLREYNEIGWKLLIELMPNEVRTSHPTYKPKWNDLVNEIDDITNKEVYEQYDQYIEMAIEYSKQDPDRISSLIEIIDDVSKDNFDKIYTKVTSEDILNIDDEKKFIIWTTTENLITKHKKSHDSEWALPEEAVKKLEKMSKMVKPSKKEIYYRRLFDSNYWDLIDEKGNYEEQEKQLLLEQIKAIEDIFTSKISNVISFSNSIKNKYKIGICLANVDLSKDDEDIIIKLLDTDEYLLAQGYINEKYKKENNWIDDVSLKEITINGKVKFLTELPKTDIVWKKVAEILGTDENEYWKAVDIRVVNSESEYDFAIKKLLECNRPIQAIELINMALYQKINFERQLSEKALKKALENQEQINYIIVYDIKNIIKDLQECKYDETKLFAIEWSYLPLLSNDEDYRPITIERKLSRDPKTYNELLCIAYKAHSDEKNKQNSDEKLASNAYRLLRIWKTPPGMTDEGIINNKELDKWIKEMKEIAKENDRIDIALYNLGQVLYYSPKDEDGFWINRDIAEVLNESDAEEIRSGYANSAYNSVGVVTVDPEGTVWRNLEEKWNKRAAETELQYFRFAQTLRDLANQYHEQAEYEKMNY